MTSNFAARMFASLPHSFTAIAGALAAAALFGLSAPAAKILLDVTDPWLLAGLLYAGSGVFLGAVLTAERVSGRGRRAEAAVARTDWLWLAAAIGVGGGAAPVLLMFGLAGGSATEASLLLNLEGVFTALIAWVVFREHVNRAIVAGMALIALGASVLAWDPAHGYRFGRSSLLVVAACVAWAADNNLTRRVSARDPVQIAALKGLIAGVMNIAIALARGAAFPDMGTLVAAGGVGIFGYGISLTLYILALRHLGAGRTAAYFSTAPFLGALGAVLAVGEPVTANLLAAAALMGGGVWLHLSERHEHEHVHEPLAHEHRHRHDEHHQHEHGPDAPPGEPHSHWHVHAPLPHSHRHFPDIHHRHGHSALVRVDRQAR
jgi:drug/metabolite transporter (DMT)-like permease